MEKEHCEKYLFEIKNRITAVKKTFHRKVRENQGNLSEGKRRDRRTETGRKREKLGNKRK